MALFRFQPQGQNAQRRICPRLRVHILRRQAPERLLALELDSGRRVDLGDVLHVAQALFAGRLRLLIGQDAV